jgi:hypothetical protein
MTVTDDRLRTAGEPFAREDDGVDAERQRFRDAVRTGDRP